MQNLTRQWITLKYEFLQNNGGQHLHKTNLMQKDPGPSGITNDSKYKAPLYIQTICSIYFCRGDIYVQSFGGFSILSIILESWYLFTAIRPGPPPDPHPKKTHKNKAFSQHNLSITYTYFITLPPLFQGNQEINSGDLFQGNLANHFELKHPGSVYCSSTKLTIHILNQNAHLF